MADNWWEADQEVGQSPPTGGGVRYGSPKPQKPRDPLEVRKDELAIANSEFDLEEKRRKATAGAPAAGQVNAQTRGAARAKVAAARSLRNQLKRVEGLFNNTIGRGKSITEYFPTAENKQFDAAVDGLMPLARQAFRVPGSGADTDKEAQYLENILPNRWSFDEPNRQRIGQLYQMLDEVETEYGPIAGIPPRQQAPAKQGWKVTRIK